VSRGHYEVTYTLVSDDHSKFKEGEITNVFITMVTDAGNFAAGMSGAFEPAQGAVGFFETEF
jgi:hypothetical protein